MRSLIKVAILPLSYCIIYVVADKTANISTFSSAFIITFRVYESDARYIFYAVEYAKQNAI